MKYIITLYFLSLAIILSVTLASRYLVGTDIHLEYFFAQHSALYGWHTNIPHPGNAAMANTVFAPFLGGTTNIEMVYKYIYPMMFAFVPVIMFLVYRRYFTDTESFIASLFFISIPTFTMEIPTIERQMFAEFFFALFILALLIPDTKLRYRLPLLIIMGGMVIISHYSLGIVLVVITLAYAVILGIMKLFKQKQLMPLWATGLMAVVMLGGSIAYYGNVASGTPLKYMLSILPFEKVAGFEKIYSDPEQFGLTSTTTTQPIITEPSVDLNIESYIDKLAGSYDSVIKAGLGLDFAKASPQGKAYRIIQLLTLLLVAIGSIYAVIRFKKLKIPVEYLALILISGGILVLCLLVPGVVAILNATRWYHIALFALAPMIVVGTKFVMRVKESNA